MNTNVSFLRAREFYAKETYLQKQNVSQQLLNTTTTKHKSDGMNLVVTKHKLTFL